MKMEITTGDENATETIIISRSPGEDSPSGRHNALFSPIVSSLTISTTGANKLPLLQVALVDVFQEVQYILALRHCGQSGRHAAIHTKTRESRCDLISVILTRTTSTTEVNYFSTFLSVYTLGAVYLLETPCLLKIKVVVLHSEPASTSF